MRGERPWRREEDGRGVARWKERGREVEGLGSDRGRREKRGGWGGGFFCVLWLMAMSMRRAEGQKGEVA